MSDQPSSKRAHVRVWQAGSASPLYFPASVFEALSHALVSGAAFFEGESLFGASVVLRLSTVSDVHFMTEASMAAAKADDEPATQDEPWRDS